MNIRFVVSGTILSTMLALPAVLSAQQSFNAAAPFAPIDGGNTAPASPAIDAAHSSAAAPANWHKNLDRWFTLEDSDYSMRYRSVTDINGTHEFNQGQQRSIIDGRFKFDKQGKYAIAFHASSGKYFNWAYADFMGGGNKQAFLESEAGATAAEKVKFGRAETADAANYLASQSSGGWSFYIREMYLDAKPIDGIEFEGGGLGINRGAASEVTTYDNDGYISGERLSIKKPSKLFLDEISVTYAYLGDVFTPNLFARTGRFTQSDYHQFLLRKHFGTRVDASFDYTWQNAANVLHEDALVNIKESRIFDTVRIEYYERLNGTYYPNVPHIATFYRTGGNGYAFTVAKKIKRLELEGTVDSIDLQSGVMTQVGVLGVMGMSVNGDQYGEGKRYLIRPTYQLSPTLAVTGYYTHLYGTQSDPTQLIWNNEALSVGFVWNIKKALFGEKPML